MKPIKKIECRTPLVVYKKPRKELKLINNTANKFKNSSPVDDYYSPGLSDEELQCCLWATD